MSSRRIKKQTRPAFEQTLKHHPPPSISLLLERGNIYGLEEKWDLAIALADQILEREANQYDALDLKRKCLHLLGRATEEIEIIKRMLALKPDLQLHSRLLFYMLYAEGMSPELVYEESQRWFALYGEPLAKEIQPHHNKPDPHRKIHVAYLSPDLEYHTIMKLLPAVLENHDRARFDISFYSIGVKRDQVSEHISKINRVVPLRPVANEIAAQARADGIDILVDLAGHTMDAAAHLVFAMKPAPVQVSWMGVMSTTGMPTIDYYVGDSHSPCPGTEHLFSEMVYRLPRISGSYRPVADIGIAESPFFKNGFITFGSFNNPRKITRDVIKMWSVILHLAPGSRLFFKFLGFEKPALQERFRSWLREDGIAAERVRFEGASAAFEYLGKWNEVDIALDSYPYNGGTTTVDALWMGVPVVTLTGRLAVSCTGANILAALGLPAACTAEQYIQTAMFLAENIPKTPAMRRTVRQALVRSALMDERALVSALESAYREMWVKWCESQKAS